MSLVFTFTVRYIEVNGDEIEFHESLEVYKKVKATLAEENTTLGNGQSWLDKDDCFNLVFENNLYRVKISDLVEQGIAERTDIDYNEYNMRIVTAFCARFNRTFIDTKFIDGELHYFFDDGEPYTLKGLKESLMGM